MQRTEATKLLRARLDELGLNSWTYRLTTDFDGATGICDSKNRIIYLNALHIDQHPLTEVLDTINHEIAHALTPEDNNHGEVWQKKAIELGALPQKCSSYAVSSEVLDALRSGQDVKIDFVDKVKRSVIEETVKVPKVTITRHQDKCPVCGKVAKERDRKEVVTSKGNKIVITLECLHVIFKDADSTSPFEKIVFDGDEKCRHDWNKTICIKCNAKRLFPFQIAGARSIERANGKLGVFDEMGLGKTIQALAYLHYHENDAWPFLWVTRSGIKFQHAKEIIRLLGKRAFPQVLQSGKDTLIPGMNVLCSYDIFRRLDMEMFKLHGFKMLVLDECQAIKNPDATRTQIIRQIAKDIPGFIPLSGTPWKNRGSEFFTVLNMLDSKRFWSYEGFKRTWINYYWEGNKQKEGGINRPEEFKKYIADLVIRRERTEVLPELPTMSRTQFMAEVPEYARKAYNDAENTLINDYNDAVIGGEEDSLATNAKIMQSLIIMRQIVGIAKVPATVELAQEFLEETNRKLVVFVHHKECGKQILEQMRAWCIENREPLPLSLTADLNPEARFEVQEKFNSPNYRLLIASTLASGEGLNLQSCSDCIMHERQWNPANEEQAEGRFIRIGQKATAVSATYVHGDDTIDPILDGIVSRKRVEFHNSMNKGTLSGWSEGGIIKELVASIAAKKRK